MLTYWRLYDDSMGWGTDSEMPQALLDELASLGVRSAATEIDLSAPDAPQALLDTTERDLGRPSILVNNATVSRQTDLQSLTSDDLDAHYAVNLRATALLCVEMARRHPTEQSGRIVNITSIVGVTGNPGQANYAAAKAGLIGMSKALAQEVAARGVTVNCVAPGFIDTAMTQALDDRQREALLGRIPSARLGTGEDIGAAVVYLASSEASYVTGQTLHVNGGMAMI